MHSLAMETTYSVLLPKLATGHYFEPLNSNLCPENWDPKDPSQNDTCISCLPRKCFSRSYAFKIVIHFYFFV
jgi:hypothetical protein